MSFWSAKTAPERVEEWKLTTEKTLLKQLSTKPEISPKKLDKIFQYTIPTGLSITGEDIMKSLWFDETHKQYEAFNQLILTINKTVLENNILLRDTGLYNDISLPLKNNISFDPTNNKVYITDINWEYIYSLALSVDTESEINIEIDWESMSISDIQSSLDNFGGDALGIQTWNYSDKKDLVRQNFIFGKETDFNDIASLALSTENISFTDSIPNNGATYYSHWYTTQSTLSTMETNITAKDITLKENSSVTIDSPLLKQKAHTLDTIFSNPKPEELIIQNPWKEEIRVRLDWDWYVSHLYNKRPPISPGVKITNVSGNEITKRVKDTETITIPEGKAIVLEDVEEKRLADIFTDHKNTTFSIEYWYTRRPDKGRTVGHRDESKGFFVDRKWKYVAIYDGVRIEEISDTEDTESKEALTNKKMIESIAWWCYGSHELWINTSYNRQLQEYLADNFRDNDIHIGNNTPKREDVYIENNTLFFGIDDKHRLNKSYHKNLYISLNSIKTDWIYDQNRFTNELWKIITYILDEQYPIQNNLEWNAKKYEAVDWKTQVNIHNLQYATDDLISDNGITECAKWTRLFTQDNMWFTFEQWYDAKDAVSHKHKEAEQYKLDYKTISINKQCPQMSVREITELLDKNLPEGNFVDAGYHSNTKNWKKYWHRNCFVHVQNEGRMVYDPVRPFSWEKIWELRPIKDMLAYSNSLKFKELAYYNSPTEVVA